MQTWWLEIAALGVTVYVFLRVEGLIRTVNAVRRSVDSELWGRAERRRLGLERGLERDS